MAKKSANRSPKDLNDMPSEEFCDWLFKKLESDDDLLPADFSNMVDEEMRHDAPGRVALVFLSKPWKQMSDSMVKDRDTALAFAEIAVRLDESIGRYKALADLLGTAQTRINLAFCGREDMQAVMAEAKAEIT